MTTNPAAVPGMILFDTATGRHMTPTATGYDLAVKRPARHRAVMTAETAWANLAVKTGVNPQPEHGAHWAPLTGWAAWVAESDAQVREIILHRDVR